MRRVGRNADTPRTPLLRAPLFRARLLRALLYGALVPPGLAGAARAETVEAGWDAYLYAAPRWSARVVDEVQRRMKVGVESCADGWCRVRYGDAQGYVREEVVRGPSDTVERGTVATDPSCFHAVQPGGNAWQDETFCRGK